LNDQICWRFSNYKYIVKNTLSKFERDLAYLKPYFSHLLSVNDHSNSEKTLAYIGNPSQKTSLPSIRPAEDLDWKFPFDEQEIKTMAEWIEYMNKELNQLIPSLDEVTSMAFNPFFLSLIGSGL
jgi:hypothetical protein